MGLKRGFTLLEVMIVVAIIAVIAAISLPYMVAYRSQAQANSCLENLRILDSATRSYVVLRNISDNEPITLEMLSPADSSQGAANYFIAKRPTCPAGGVYSYSTTLHSWCCSLGGGPNANNGFPHGQGSN